MYIISTTDSDTEAGYPEFRREAINKEYAFAAILDAESECAIPSHRLTVTKYLRDIEAEDGQYMIWSDNAEVFMADNQSAVDSMITRLLNKQGN